MTFHTYSQDTPIPYSQIPPHPEKYTAGSVAARLIDGLGFRYYWATAGLRDSDLEYRPSPEARTLRETLDHIYGLSLIIANAPQGKVNQRPVDLNLDYNEIRIRTLENLKTASGLLMPGNDQNMESYRLIFKRGEQQFEFPFWNLINGPISDALWHTGQVVLMRRAAGNPINSKVDVFSGKLNE